MNKLWKIMCKWSVSTETYYCTYAKSKDEADRKIYNLKSNHAVILDISVKVSYRG
jgi:hypothetical protein